MAIILLSLFLALALFYFWATSGTLPEEDLAAVLTYPVSQEPQADQETFTFMTYNIGYLSGMTNNLPIKEDKAFFEKNMTTFLETLAKTKPDFIAFQEIDYNSSRSYNIDQLSTIAHKAGYGHAAKAVNWDKHYVPFPYWPPSVHFGRTLSGQAVLSRWPIASAERHVLARISDKPFYYNAFYLDRLMQVVKLTAAGHELILINLHLEAYSPDTRQKQIKTVLTTYRKYKNDYPVLVVGDFNCTPPGAPHKNGFADEPETDYTNDRTIEMMLAEPDLRPAFPSADAFTFPTAKPDRKLDYIFYDHRKIKVMKTDIPHLDSSDHLPLVIKFIFL